MEPEIYHDALDYLEYDEEEYVLAPEELDGEFYTQEKCKRIQDRQHHGNITTPTGQQCSFYIYCLLLVNATTFV